MSHHSLIPNPDIIVVGTSAGGLEALQKIVSKLPEALPASLFIVMHIPAHLPSALPQLLARSSKLPVFNPQPDQQIESGRVYVAPPDYHLVVERNKSIALWHGPKENNFRPAINPLFRSAAEVYGDRVIGVILTGSLDEGVAGLAWVKRHEGVTIVQDPTEAKYSEMPESALKYVAVDYVAPVSQIPELLVRMVNGSQPVPGFSDERRS
jgi:two-component system chemotaxis response regulator CheB